MHGSDVLPAERSEGSQDPGRSASEETRATLVFLDVARVPAAKTCLKRQAVSVRGELVIVVLVLGALEDRAAAVQAKLDLLAEGADEVVGVSRAGLAALPAIIDMAIAGLQVKRAAEWESERRIEQEMHAKETCREPVDGLFWQCAHKIWSSLPQLTPELDAELDVGSCVGSRRLEKRIGRGGFGRVFMVSSTETRSIEAVKILAKDRVVKLSQVKSIHREIKLLRSFSHKNIVTCTGVLHGPGHILICMDYAGERNLSKMVTLLGGCLYPEHARLFEQQLLSAIDHMHGQRIAHRDIKPENIVVTDDGATIKLVDFGSCAVLDQKCRDMAGTMPFMSPEILWAGNSELYMPSRCDIWAAGVVLLEMLCGFGKLNRMLNWPSRPTPGPARCDELYDYFEDFRSMHDSLVTDLGNASNEPLELLVGMFQLSLEDRWTAADCLEHDWLAAR